ncbi:MAG: hypothetical protein NXI32_25930, partial [bacterium]|nr:hypothetical protein [bacterium]
MDHNLQSHDIPEPIYEQLLKPAAAQVEFRVASGLSSARVFCCRNPQGRLCLRGWPETGPDLRRLEQMRQFVSLTHQHNIHVLPSYFTDARGQAFHWAGGRYWELTQWMPGVADYLQHPSQERLEAACEVLGQLHRIWSSHSQLGSSPAVADRIQRLHAWLHRPNALGIWQVNPGAANIPASIEIGTRPESREGQLWLATMQAIQRHGPRVHELLKAISDSEVGLHFVLRDVWSDHILF